MQTHVKWLITFTGIDHNTQLHLLKLTLKMQYGSVIYHIWFKYEYQAAKQEGKNFLHTFCREALWM